MKSKKIICLMVLSVVLSITVPTFTMATSVDDMKKQEEQAKKDGEVLNTEIDSVVASINAKYQEIAKLDKDIKNSKNIIAQTEKDIEDTQDSIEKRTELIAGRMQELQVRGMGQNAFQTLLESTSFSDFLNRAYAVTVLQSAEKSKVESLYSDKEKLDELEVKLTETQTNLENQQETVLSEKEVLDEEVKGLQKKVAENASTLQKLTEDRIAKEEQARKEKEEQERKAAQEAEDAKRALENTNKEKPGVTGGGSPAPVPPITPPSSVTPPSGSTNGQATAYVATGNNTATGTVPMPHHTIAVDPSVIPLGSFVQIIVPSAPQYSGIYRAEDTGGVVHGNIIDIFVGSEGEATNFGRRAITFSVM